MYYAEVVVNLPVEGTFHYHVPAQFAGRVKVGHLIEVTFGKQRAQGIVLSFERRRPAFETKPIENLIDHEPVVNQQQLLLARWLSETYHTPISACVRLFIPPGLSKRGDILVIPVIDPEEIEPLNDTQNRLLKLLARRGALRGRQIARSLPRRHWRDAVTNLVERGLVLREPVLANPSVKAKQVRMVEISIPPENVEAVIDQAFNPEHLPSTRHRAAARRAEILRFLTVSGDAVAASEIYASVENSTLTDLRVLAEDDYVLLQEQEMWRDPLAGKRFIPDIPPKLTRYQHEAWDVIHKGLDAQSPSLPVLLHGVTGSGKTELYMRAAQYVIERGQSAIIMVPEIALTPQTVQRFGARFRGRMGLVHSGLSQGERYDTWRRARSGQYDMVIGPRSALFTPLQNIGLVVMDECHDDSYKQTPPIAPPYYHAQPTAIELARLNNGLLIMGSATPNVASYANSARTGTEEPGNYTLVDLPARIMGHRKAIEAQALHFRITDSRYVHSPGDPDEAVMIDLPPVQIVDMRQELRANNRSIFSRALQQALEETLHREEQAILFLNRRGTATYVFCRACGHVLVCPRCDIPLTWHTIGGESETGRGMLVCHHCNYRTNHPSNCPQCSSDQIKFFGGGTERVEGEVKKLFPDARVLRWDTDTTKGRFAHDKLLDRFVNHEVDVLIGTQMVAKGLDLPLVTLVGVISADTALYLPDYRSNERTFQLLTQVAGRAGRGLFGGRVILQSYEPHHYAIQAASEHDFYGFYEQEIAYRSELGYPPFSRLVRIEVRGRTVEEAKKQAKRLYQLLDNHIKENDLRQTALIGPAPCFYARRDNIFRWHIIIRGPEPASLVKVIRSAPGIYVDIDPVSML